MCTVFAIGCHGEITRTVYINVADVSIMANGTISAFFNTTLLGYKILISVIHSDAYHIPQILQSKEIDTWLATKTLPLNTTATAILSGLDSTYYHYVVGDCYIIIERFDIQTDMILTYARNLATQT